MTNFQRLEDDYGFRNYGNDDIEEGQQTSVLKSSELYRHESPVAMSAAHGRGMSMSMANAAAGGASHAAAFAVSEAPNAHRPFDPDLPGSWSWNPVNWIRAYYNEFREFSLTMTEKRRVLLRAIFGEGLCSFLFFFIVMACAVNNGRQEQPENLVLGCIATAFCSVALIYSFADVSGAHFNPAVTFATLVTGKVSINKAFAFITIQCLASVLATAFLMVVFPAPYGSSKTADRWDIPATVTVDIEASTHPVNAFFMEMALTFILVYVIFATAFDTVNTEGTPAVVGEDGVENGGRVGTKLTIYTASGNTKAGFAPLSIGFTLGFLGLLGNSVSGGAFNPARVFGPAMLSGNWSNHWLYWIADFLGAALAGWTQHFFAHEATQDSASSKARIKAKVVA